MTEFNQLLSSDANSLQVKLELVEDAGILPHLLGDQDIFNIEFLLSDGDATEIVPAVLALSEIHEMGSWLGLVSNLPYIKSNLELGAAGHTLFHFTTYRAEMRFSVAPDVTPNSSIGEYLTFDARHSINARAVRRLTQLSGRSIYP